MKQISLRISIDNQPVSISALAKDLDFSSIGYLSPQMYRSKNPHHFDEEKAKRNLKTITEILDGQDIMVTDLEKHPRRVVRDPDDYEEEEVKWANNQFLTMWQWFRSEFPKLKLSEWGFAKAQYDGDQAMAEKLMLTYTDTIDASVFWRLSKGWHASRSNYISRAVELGKSHHKPVILWVQERYRAWNKDRTVSVYHPLSEQAMDEMLDMVMREGVDVVVLWSNTYTVLNNNNPSSILVEQIGQKEGYDPRPLIDARMALLLSKMRLRKG